MLKKLFNDKKLIFMFTFIVQIIFYYVFEYLFLGGNYILPDIGIAPIAGLVFGPVGALGNALGSFVFAIYEGIDFFSAIIDTGIQFFISILTFKLWYSTFIKRPINTPKFDSIYNLLKFFVIMFIVSVTYLTFINLSYGAYSGFRTVYPILEYATIPYFLNMLTFSIIFGLLIVSLFNILKIPMQSPKKWINLVNIHYNHFIAIFSVLLAYSIFTIIFNIIDNDLFDNIFFLLTALTAILFIFNRFDVEIKIEHTNYSIIEEIILIFLFMLAITITILFDNTLFTIAIISDTRKKSLLILIALTFNTAFVIFLSMIHIYYVEKTITNPLYDLINILKGYGENEEFSEDENIKERFKKYLKNDDDISRLIDSFIHLKNNIQENLRNIRSITAEKERIGTEFNVANKIQSNMLKRDFEEFSKGKSFEIYGFMNPAREVGGDFYDYFQIDEDNIGFVIGDVSGKGVPATLFMVKTMYLIRNHSKFKESPNEVFENVNDLSCQRNDGELFITSWFGKLNLKTGKLTFVNAGHNPPLIKQNNVENNENNENNPNTTKNNENKTNNNRNENNPNTAKNNENKTNNNKNENNSNNAKSENNSFEYLKIRPNLVLGGMEGIPYKEHELYLNEGDTIFLYTDGITEANNDYQGFYGEDRLKETINKYENERLDKILENIKNDVYDFCKDENQFDDMTMLILKYNGSESNG